MVSMTLAIPDDLKKEMDKRPEMNWSEVARQSIRNRIEILKQLDEMLKNSKVTEEDALRLGRLVRKGVSEAYRKKYGKYVR